MNDKRSFRYLQLVAAFKRGLRLALRSVWLGASGVLILWGVEQLTGQRFDLRYYLAAGSALAFLPVFQFLVQLPRLRALTWALDRKLGYREQISTAWSVLKSGQTGPIAAGLLHEVQQINRQILIRLLKKGWFLEREILSLVIVVVLGFMVYNQYAGTQVLPSASETVRPLSLPAPGQDPAVGEVFPEGMIGLLPESGESPAASAAEAGEGGAGAPNLTQEDLDALYDVMAEMGSRLSDQMSTYELSQSLKNGDLKNAATEIEKWSDQYEQLVPETILSVAEALGQAAEQLTQDNFEDFSQEMRQVSESLTDNARRSSNKLPVKKELDQFAESMRELGKAVEQAQSQAGQANVPGDVEEMAAGDPQGGAAPGSKQAGLGDTSSQLGTAETFRRLAGEGERIVLEEVAEMPAGLVAPGKDQQAGAGVVGGSLEGLRSSANTRGGAILIPQYFPWNARHVVEAFFEYSY